MHDIYLPIMPVHNAQCMKSLYIECCITAFYLYVLAQTITSFTANPIAIFNLSDMKCSLPRVNGKMPRLSNISSHECEHLWGFSLQQMFSLSQMNKLSSVSNFQLVRLDQMRLLHKQIIRLGPKLNFNYQTADTLLRTVDRRMLFVSKA